MILVGIDFSLNSTGCVILMDNKYIWLNFCANLKENNKPFIHHKAMKSFVSINDYKRNVPKTGYVDEQTYKQLNAGEIATKISNIIKSVTGDYDVRIAFEGFAYGAKGRSFIDLIAYNSFTKYKLIEEFGKGIVVFSPAEIKRSHTGKGNCGKDIMFKHFLDSKDKRLKGDKFHEYCSQLEWTEGDVPKPIDDIVDAYAIVMRLEEYLKTD